METYNYSRIKSSIEATQIPREGNDDYEAAMSYIHGFVDALTDGQRVDLRNRLMADGIERLPRNLFYNYDKQYWIEDETRFGTTNNSTIFRGKGEKA